MDSFGDIWERAVARHGEEALRERFPRVRTPTELRAHPDDRCLAEMTRFVFAAGFRWRVIEAKWDGFEEAFHAFDPGWVAALDADGIEGLAVDTRIVRNRPKIQSTVNNARFVLDVARAHGSFGAWVADWPTDDIVSLWAALKDGGDRLGGNTGPWFLRHLGKDTFRISTDVGQALVEAGVVPKPPTGKRALAATQAAFNAWAAASGLSLGAVSVVLACSTGERYER